ncbi:MAG: nucleoside deaminase [Candidatus Heimdallarchaeota archaeon]
MNQNKTQVINTFMKEAISLAKKSLEKGELPIAAVVVLNNEIIASAHTAEKEEKRRLVHAELLALEIADKITPFPGKRNEVMLFSTLEPCIMSAMSFGVGEVFYSLEAPQDGGTNLIVDYFKEKNNLIGYNLPIVEGGFLRNESIKLFKEYIIRYPSGSLSDWAKHLANLQ